MGPDSSASQLASLAKGEVYLHVGREMNLNRIAMIQFISQLQKCPVKRHSFRDGPGQRTGDLVELPYKHKPGAVSKAGKRENCFLASALRVTYSFSQHRLTFPE